MMTHEPALPKKAIYLRVCGGAIDKVPCDTDGFPAERGLNKWRPAGLVASCFFLLTAFCANSRRHSRTPLWREQQPRLDPQPALQWHPTNCAKKRSSSSRPQKEDLAWLPYHIPGLPPGPCCLVDNSASLSVLQQLALAAMQQGKPLSMVEVSSGPSRQVELGRSICFFLPHVTARRRATSRAVTYHGHNVLTVRAGWRAAVDAAGRRTLCAREELMCAGV